MDESRTVHTNPGAANGAGPYTIYSAGGLFTQDELAANVMIKEAVWRLSNGKFQLFLPQSREVRELDRPDVEAHVRNTDLLEVVRADMILARFDSVELDSGTVVEYMMAKSLGKPAVILRCDFRRLYGTGLPEPYNLMVKNWPRTVAVHLDSFRLYTGILAQESQAGDGPESLQATLKAELATVQKSVDEIARQVIAGMEAVLKMESPYPPEYQELVYEAARFTPGCGFDQLLTTSELRKILQRLRINGTL